MKGVWIIIIIVALFITYAYFGFGDERVSNVANVKDSQSTTTPGIEKPADINQ